MPFRNAQSFVFMRQYQPEQTAQADEEGTSAQP
jgi:hypothetical protein